MIDQRLRQASQFAALVSKHPRFIVLNAVNLNSVVLSYLPDGCESPLTIEQFETASNFNRLIYDLVLKQGHYYIHSFRITDNSNVLGCGLDRELDVLRYMSGNPLVTDETFQEALDYLAKIGQALERTSDTRA